jgi:hypothetical protein
MSTIADFYNNSVKGQIGKENWAKISAGKADEEIIAIAKLCAVATGKETIDNERELIAKATKGLQKLGIGKDLSTPTTAVDTDNQNDTQQSTTAAESHTPNDSTKTTPTSSTDKANPIEGLTKRINDTLIKLAQPNLSEEEQKKLQDEVSRLRSVRDELEKEAARVSDRADKVTSETAKQAEKQEQERQKQAKQEEDKREKEERERVQAAERKQREERNRAIELERLVQDENARIERDARKQNPASFRNDNSNRGVWIRGNEIQIGFGREIPPTRDEALLVAARKLARSYNVSFTNEDDSASIAQKIAQDKFNKRYPNNTASDSQPIEDDLVA